ncbi:AIR synthase-related protein [Oligoflexia bacterium]|nr:AIR synthase-related protein [Oligoflexia bacterium]
MNSQNSKESTVYADLGASSSKGDVHKALKRSGSSPYFADLQEDVCGDENYFSLLHADGAGTKSIVAYICFRETGDPSWFKSLAQDSLVMNLDDIICVNAFESLALSNTIGRNKFLIPDGPIQALIDGYKQQVEQLNQLGITIKMSGGETADLGDLVRTIVIDSTLFARVKKAHAITTDNITAGDIIVGLSNTGQATYETEPNSGLGSNGFTLARHALIANKYLDKYAEIADPSLGADKAYQGQWDLFDTPQPLEANVAKTLLSPTRTYAPIIKRVNSELGQHVHGIIHCTGGGQTKITGFGKAKHYVKNSLFNPPPVFALIQSTLNVPWRDMYAVFNMGHRMEIVCPAEHLKVICDIAKEFNIDAQQIGYVEGGGAHNSLLIETAHGKFEYQ